MRPEHGGRLELKLVHASATTARYALAIFSGYGEANTEVSVESETGALEFAAWQATEPPAWLQAFARALLRTVLRQKSSAGDWPRRITRWRPEPPA